MSVPALPSFLDPFDSFDELCPLCGQFTNQLDDTTGWCATCTQTNVHNVNTVSPVVSNQSQHRGRSNRSKPITKLELALAANADAIEQITASVAGVTSITKALELARSDRPTCIVCGERIKRSSRSAVICRQHPLCRFFSRRYVYLYRERKPPMSKAEALSTILQQLSS